MDAPKNILGQPSRPELQTQPLPGQYR